MSIVNLLAGDNVTIESRILKYTVDWGRPFGGMSYDHFVISGNPVGYWLMLMNGDVTTQTNWGTFESANNADEVPVDNTTPVESLIGLPRNCSKLQGLESGWGCGLLDLGGDDHTFTVSCWIRPDRELTNGTFDPAKGLIVTYGTSIKGWLISRLKTGQLHFGTNDGNINIAGTAILEKDKVYHIAVTVDNAASSKKVILYVNGVVDAETTYTGTLETPTVPVFVIGALFMGATGDPLPPHAGSKPYEGAIESVALYKYAMAAGSILKQYRVGASKGYYIPRLDIDTSTLETNIVSQTYQEYVAKLDPEYWYRMNELAGDAVAVDAGSIGVNGTYNSNGASASKLLPGATIESEETGGVSNGKALYGDANSKMTSDAELSFGLAHETELPGFTLAFWTCQGDNYSRNLDDLMGTTDYEGNDTSGFYVGIYEDEVWFACRGLSREKYQIKIPKQYMANVPQLNDLTQTDYALYVFTIDSNNVLHGYVDGEEVVAAVQGVHIYAPPTGAKFVVGHLGVADTNPEQAHDEVALWDRALTAGEVKDLFSIGRYGKDWSGLVVGSRTTPTSFTGYSVSDDELPSLSDETDITKYVGDYSIDRDITQFIDVATLTCHEEWDADFLLSNVRANDYIIMQEKHTSLDGLDTAGWFDVGHFLVEGPANDNYDPDSAAKPFQYVLKGVLKLTTLDLITRNQEPDRYVHTHVELERTSVIGGTAEFQFQRPGGVPGGYTYNWAKSPSVTIYASKFNNITKPYPETGDIPASLLPERISIKSAQNAIQVVGGEGAIRIDQDFYEDSLGEGMGDPEVVGGVHASFERFATVEDVQAVTIQSLEVVDGNFCVRLDGPGEKEAGRTLFIDSGLAMSKLFKLWPKFDSVVRTDMAQAVDSGGGDWGWGVAEVPPDLSGEPWFGGGALLDMLTSNTRSAYVYANAPDVFVALGGIPNTLDSNIVTLSGLDLSALPTEGSLKVLGIEVRMRRWAWGPTVFSKRDNTGYKFGPWGDISGTVSYDDPFCDLILLEMGVDGTFSGINFGNQEKQYPSSGSYINDTQTSLFYESALYGDPTNLWGLTSLTIDDLDRLQLRLQTRINIASRMRDSLSDRRTAAGIEHLEFVVYVETVAGLSTPFVITDYDGYIVNPTYEGLVVGDACRVGDASRGEDALAKMLLYSEMQRTDPTRPFYFALEAIPSDFSSTVPPLEYDVFDGRNYADAINDIREFLPPNYILYTTPSGEVRTVNLVQANEADHDLTKVNERGIDRTDFGVYTRVVGVGEGRDSFDLAVRSTAAIRAYKLTNWAEEDDDTGLSGSDFGKTYDPIDSDYAIMNAYLAKIMDGSQKTPRANDSRRYPGVIWAESGSSVYQWDWDEQDLFAIDIGRNEAAGLAYFIESIQYTHTQTYVDGTGVSQAITIWYMSEEDYLKSTQKNAPAIPSQTSADKAESYFPEATSPHWKLLVDKVECQSGQNTINAGDFETQEDTRVRFLKIRCHQGHHFPAPSASDAGKKKMRISFTDFKVWSARRIVATAVLGQTAEHGLGTGSFKQFAGRLRNRTYVLDRNPYNDTYDKTKKFTTDQLRELARDFNPASVAGYHPTADILETVKVTNPETGVETLMVVRAANRAMSGYRTFHLVDYKVTSEGVE